MAFPSYMLMKERLNEDYLEVFERVENYAMSNGIGEDTIAEKMMDLLDMMSEAQAAGKTSSQIVGTDIEQFCRNYFGDYRLKDKLADSLKTLRSFAWPIFVLELLWILVHLGDEDFNLLTTTNNISSFMAGIAIGLISNAVLRMFIKPFRTKMKTKTFQLINTLFGIFVLVLAAISILVLGENELAVPVLPVLLISGGYLLLYYIFTWVTHYKKTGTIKKEKNAYKTSFSAAVKQEINDDTPFTEDLAKVLAKRYEKMNKKRAKKGKEPLDTESFFIALEKEYKRADLAERISFVVICIGFTIFIGMESTLVDTLIFAVIISIVEYAIYKFFHKFTQVSADGRKQIRNKCKEQNISLLEYVARFEVDKS